MFGALFRIVNELNAWSLRETRSKAAAGDVREQYLLASAYLDGSGVEQNNWEAAYWFQRAAEQGHARAQTSLGILYLLGRGVPKDPIEGAKWLIVASRRGHAPAKKAFETAKVKLSEEELASAEQYAGDFLMQWEDDQAAIKAEEEQAAEEERKRNEAETGAKVEGTVSSEDDSAGGADAQA